MAAKKGAEKVLMMVAFTESIFFPIPQDLLLIPMGLSRPRKVFRLATLCLVASVLGGVVGYFIGLFFMELVGLAIINFYGLADKYLIIQEWYDRYDAWAVAVAGISPVPYKVCTLTAGAFKINFAVFVIASVLSRGLRFYLVAAVIYWQGERARDFLEKRFDLVVSLTLVLVVLGFILIKFI
ncbi:YqaA family protein [Desulfonatronovibrio hydrogenovorans]|uniref:YqaA family protein n=1 Tax=Desulfonatronovibrio hydrogenovorans TaxID=53245 RepID=UPI000AC563DC|nr:YqaA family protein [Desulfonatronovibrio hydrogenovorans]